ncbi:MAG: hypothetical protein PVI01_17430 [Gemmatimonadales bacterium]|jgi:hypothetical protein
MRYLRLALLPLVFAACTEQQPAAPDIGVTPDFGATAGRDVVYAHPGRVTWMDNDPALEEPWDVFLLGYDPADDFACNDGDMNVGGIPVLEHYVTQEVLFDTRDLSLAVTIGRPPMYLYTRASLPPGDASNDVWCDFLTNDWIAAGSWHSAMVDNDVSGFGAIETGVLFGDDGAMYKYSWKYRAHCDPETGCRTLNGIDRVERIK